jgi:hypothetical protein
MEEIFSPYFEVYFHGSVESPANFGFDMHYITQFDRVFKAQVINRSGHAGRIAMFACGYSGGNVHPVHQPSPHEVSKSIGIIGQYQLVHSGETF